MDSRETKSRLDCCATLRLKTPTTRKEEADADGRPLHVFTLTHAYLANQGGFKINLRRTEPSPPGETDASSWDACAPFLTGELLKGVQYQYPYSPLRYLNVTEAEIRDERIGHFCQSTSYFPNHIASVLDSDSLDSPYIHLST